MPAHSRAAIPKKAEPKASVTPTVTDKLVALLVSGRAVEAEYLARALVAQHPTSGHAWKVLGIALSQQGKYSLDALRRAAELLPDDAETHHNMTSVLLGLGRIDEAATRFRRCLEINPNFAGAHSGLGSALRDLGRPDEAMACFRRAIEIKPDDARSHFELSVLLRTQGHVAESEVHCRCALALAPEMLDAICFMAELCADQGKFADALNMFQRIISMEPDSPEAWAGIARMRKMTAEDGAWLAAAQRIAGTALPSKKEAFLRYSLGKYFNDVQDYDQAFRNYRRANELTKLYTGTKYDRRLQTQIGEVRSRVFDRSWIKNHRCSENSSARPVFIVGMPRSGTSLAEQILASHPDIFGAGELSFWNTAAAKFEPSMLTGKNSRRVLQTLAGQYFGSLNDISSDTLRVIDKMPGNFLYLGMIHAAFPHARIIHMQRNPIDTCLSIYFQHFNNAISYANDLEDLAHFYREYLRIMEHWCATLPEDAILHVPYEALVDDQEGWSREMLAFIDLPWDDRCLHFHENVRTVMTASNWQVRQKIDRSSVERWRNYENCLGPLLTLPLTAIGSSSVRDRRPPLLVPGRRPWLPDALAGRQTNLIH